MKTKAYQIILTVLAIVFLLGGYLWAEELLDLEKSSSSPEAVKYNKKKPHLLYLENLEAQLEDELGEIEYPDATVGENHAETPEDSEGSGQINDGNYPEGIGGEQLGDSSKSGQVNNREDEAS